MKYSQACIAFVHAVTMHGNVLTVLDPKEERISLLGLGTDFEEGELLDTRKSRHVAVLIVMPNVRANPDRGGRRRLAAEGR